MFINQYLEGTRRPANRYIVENWFPDHTYIFRIDRGQEYELVSTQSGATVTPLSIGETKEGRIDNTDPVLLTTRHDVYSITIPEDQECVLYFNSDAQGIQAEVFSKWFNRSANIWRYPCGKVTPGGQCVLERNRQYYICVTGGELPLTAALPYRLAVFRK